MKRWAVLIMFVLGFIVVLPRWAAAQSDTEPSPEALQRFRDQLLAGDVQPLIDPSRPQPERRPVRVLAPEADAAWITYQSYRDGNWEIYLAHDSGEYRLTAHPSSDSRPRLNRGATQVVFNSNRDGNYEIYKMNTDGSGVLRLTASAGSDIMPVWSPDGSQIAFASNRTGDYEIYAMNADGSGLRRLTYSGQTDDVSPSWSPDGAQLSWVQTAGNYGAINVMQADGSGGGQVLGGQPYLSDAVWSPTGTRFAFDYISNPSYYPATSVYVINVDGSGLRRVFDANNYWVDYYVGAWGPDGWTIMYTRAEYGVFGGQVYLFYAYIEHNNADVYQTPTRVTWTGMDMNPDWQVVDIKPPTASMDSLPNHLRHTGFTVSWSGSDVGAAGIRDYDVQARVNNGAWTAWQSAVSSQSAIYSGSAGQTVSFRCRARDWANNFSPWSNPVSTRLYTWQITGTVRDTRDTLMPRAAVIISPTALAPITTSLSGGYHSYLKASGTHQLRAASAGYGTAFTLSSPITADTTVATLWLPPADELFDNPGFEASGWSGWQVAGSPLPQVINSIKYTGGQAATLGQPAEFNYTLPDEVTPGVFWDAVTDRAQTTYLYGQLGDITTTYQAAVALRPITGTWPLTPTSLMSSTSYFSGLSLLPDESGGFHALWRPGVADDGQLVYCHIASLTSGCPGPEVITAHATTARGIPRLALDRLGGVHAIWLTPGDFSLQYAVKPQGGSWSTPETIVVGNASNPAFGVDDELTVHVVWSLPSGIDYINYIYKEQGGSWSSPESIGTTFPFNPFFLTVEPNGSLHFNYVEAGSMRVHYRYKPAHQPWFPYMYVTADEYGLRPIYQGLSTDGVLHLVYRSGSSGEMLNYRVRKPDATWLRPVDPFTIGSASALATSDAVGIIHLLWSSGDSVWHTQTMVATQPLSYTLLQTMTVPVNAHKLTLSLLYRAEDTWQLGANRLAAEIDNGVTISEVLSQPVTTTQWSHRWADVSDWAGQTVTLSLKLIQPSGSPAAQVYLDDASLGSWLTPRVTGISQDHVEAWITQPVTLTGENFVATPTVQIGTQVIPNVLWVDDHTLSLALPALAPGNYSVVVSNPGGQIGLLPWLLVVGRQTFLPVMRR